MTPAELSLCLDDNIEEERPPMGGAAMSAVEIEEYARRWRALTPQERLTKIREG